MAGDWIKLQCTTPDKPEVFRIADLLNIDPDAVVGKLLRVWIWADQQTSDGNAVSVTHSLLDHVTGVSGFASAMLSVGWLIESENGFSFTNFDRHNGQTAKSRALTYKRVTKSRNADSVTKTLPEKRRDRDREEIEDTSLSHVAFATNKSAEPVAKKLQSVAPEQCDEVVAIWNSTVGVKPIITLTADRRRKLFTRLRDPAWPWREAIARLPIPGDGWQPDFDWMLRNATNAVSIVEGKFDFRAHMNQRKVNCDSRQNTTGKRGSLFG